VSIKTFIESWFGDPKTQRKRIWIYYKNCREKEEKDLRELLKLLEMQIVVV